MAASETYAPGTVRMLIESDLVTPATRAVLKARLAVPPVVEPRFFSRDMFGTIGAVCDRLIPQPERPRPVDLPGALDSRLADGASDGWRYATMPPDEEMHRMGMTGIDQAAAAIYDRTFIELPTLEQDVVLRGVQAGTASGSIWAEMDGARYFEELLSLVTEIYYAHPLASEEIGTVAMADAHGWQAIGLNERETHEPVAAARMLGAE